MRLIKQIIYLFLTIWLTCAPLNVLAFFNDIEVSLGVVLSLGTLDFSLFSSQNNFVPAVKANNMDRGDKVERMIQVRQEGSLLFDYIVEVLMIGGDQDFCQVLELEAKMQGINYTGGLLDFVANQTMDKNIHTWQFKILLPDDTGDELAGKFCQFKFVFTGQQANQLGFFDQEELTSIITATDSFQPTEDPVPTGVIRIQTTLDRSL